MARSEQHCDRLSRSGLTAPDDHPKTPARQPAQRVRPGRRSACPPKAAAMSRKPLQILIRGSPRRPMQKPRAGSTSLSMPACESGRCARGRSRRPPSAPTTRAIITRLNTDAPLVVNFAPRAAGLPGCVGILPIPNAATLAILQSMISVRGSRKPYLHSGLSSPERQSDQRNRFSIWTTGPVLSPPPEPMSVAPKMRPMIVTLVSS